MPTWAAQWKGLPLKEGRLIRSRKKSSHAAPWPRVSTKNPRDSVTAQASVM